MAKIYISAPFTSKIEKGEINKPIISRIIDKNKRNFKRIRV
jgi:hypothetical protein